jgi:hypothetical protein
MLVMRAAVRILLGVLGGAAVAIAFAILVFGPTQTAWAFERLFALATGWRGPPGEPWPSTMDSEVRFYAALWGAFGLVAIDTARHLRSKGRRIPWLMLAFFAGGVGRVISWIAVGPPHPFFSTLMVTELALPPVVFLLWLGSRRRTAAH